MKRLLACAALVLAFGCQNEVPILTYHWLGTGNEVPWDLEPERFRDQMDELVSRGCTSVTLDQLYDYLDGKADLPPRPVAITFDDGDLSVYQTALPILRERGLNAILFVVTDLIAERPEERVVWKSGEAYLPMLVWPEVRALADSGVVEIGSHSRSHPMLSHIPLDEAAAEIEGSKRILEEKLARPVRYFAYPGHAHNADVMERVERAGYRGAVDGGNRIGGRFDLFRMSIWRGSSLEEFRRALALSWADAYSQPASAR